LIVPPNGWRLSPDLIFDQIEDPVQRDCGADNFQFAENEMVLFALWRSAPQVHCNYFRIKTKSMLA
jgi:hypothetical protein